MMAIHLGWLLPATSSNLPGHRYRIAPVARGNACPYMVLLRMGFTMPVLLPARRCALTAPFHPYRHIRFRHPAVCFLWHFPWVAPPGVTRHPDPVEPGLSSPFAEAKAAAIRSSDKTDYTLAMLAWSSERPTPPAHVPLAPPLRTASA